MLPGWFREEFGREMTQAFVDSRGSLFTNAPAVMALAIRLHIEALRQDLRLRTAHPAANTDVHGHRHRHPCGRPGPNAGGGQFPLPDRVVAAALQRARSARAVLARASRAQPDASAAVDPGLHGLPREAGRLRSVCRAHGNKRRDDHRWCATAGDGCSHDIRSARRAPRASAPRPSTPAARRGAGGAAGHRDRSVTLAQRIRGPGRRHRHTRQGRWRRHHHRRSAARWL